MQTNNTPNVEFTNTMTAQELKHTLDKLFEWAKGQEEKLIPVLEGLCN